MKELGKGRGDELAGALVKPKTDKDLVEPGETEEELKKRRDRERDEIDRRLADIEGKLLHTEQQIQVCATEILQLTATLQKEADKTAELKKKYLDLKTTMDLLSNAEENMKKMKEMAINQKNQLVKLAMKWEETRAPIVEEYRALKDSHSKREGEIAKKLEELKVIREEMQTHREQIKKKEARLKQLQEILKNVPKENRNTYTTKILFLVGAVKKQRVEISKILIDMRNVQKDINSTSEKLNRTFVLVEEMIYADAKKDPTGKSSYTLTVQLNKIFIYLTELITKT
jgi:chromosome segregation ATPase